MAVQAIARGSALKHGGKTIGHGSDRGNLFAQPGGQHLGIGLGGLPETVEGADLRTMTRPGTDSCVDGVTRADGFTELMSDLFNSSGINLCQFSRELSSHPVEDEQQPEAKPLCAILRHGEAAFFRGQNP